MLDSSGLKGTLKVTVPFLPKYTHNQFRTTPTTSGTTTIGAKIVRSNETKYSTPRVDGYGFSFLLDGDSVLIRLAYVLNLARVAGVKLEYYDANDKPLTIPTIFE